MRSIYEQITDDYLNGRTNVPTRLERATAEIAMLRQAIERVVAVPPTGFSEKNDCIQCRNGTINVGTAVDPEPGPCPACCCELHQERHPDCMEALRRALTSTEVK